MTASPENFLDSTPTPKPNLAIFHCLEKRYTKGFFSEFINKYFLLLLEDSSRLQWEAAYNFDKTLELVFNPELIDAKCFSTYFLHGFIYRDSKIPTENHELHVLENEEKFFLTCKYAHLNKLKFQAEDIKNQLLRTAALLVTQIRMNFPKPTQPQFIVTTEKGVDFCSPDIISKSVGKYKKECANAVKRLDPNFIIGKTYTPLLNEYFGFVDLSIKNHQTILNEELREVLNRWYHQFAQVKIDTDQDIGEVLQPTPGPLYYLKGRPSGSAQKK